MEDRKPKDDGRVPGIREIRAGQQIEGQQLDYLEKALATLWDVAERDCYCEDGDNSYKCDYCVAQEARELIEKAIYPVVRTLNPERLSFAEKVYFEKWLDENTRKRGINGGCGLLELILGRDGRRDTITQRDMDVATTLFQWLGTACGRATVHECEQEAARRDEVRSDLFKYQHNHKTFRALQKDDPLVQHATDIADRWAKPENRSSLKSEILGLLVKQGEKIAESIATSAFVTPDEAKP